mmetsp:Transcript_11693/g.23992  ORF Transcript_11693/g.23992 Transcript_11693/m.23992 type:complete len:113 (-) Transcript_11693:87-425(-)
MVHKNEMACEQRESVVMRDERATKEKVCLVERSCVAGMTVSFQEGDMTSRKGTVASTYNTLLKFVSHDCSLAFIHASISCTLPLKMPSGKGVWAWDFRKNLSQLVPTNPRIS